MTLSVDGVRQVTRPAAYCVMYNEAGEILLTEWKRNGRGGWTLPGGGLNFGESPEAAAIREVYEETGLHVELLGNAHVTSQHFPAGVIAPDAEFHAIRFVYRARVLSGSLQIIDVGGTTTDLGWFSLADAKELPLTETALEAMTWLPSGLVHALEHVQLAIPPGGEDQSRSYWRDVLGLIEVPKPPALAVRGGAHFMGNGFQVHVGIEDRFVPARKAHPAFCCLNIDQIARVLTTAGYEVRWSHEIPGTRRFHTDDPFNNRLEFTE